VSLASSLFTALSASGAATAALVGTGSACKVYPAIAPAGTAAPYVVWQDVATSPVVTHDGPSTKCQHSVQFSCVASTYLGALALGAAIIADLDSVALAGGELCTQCTASDGFSDTTDQHLRIVEALIWASA
jgi:hypothetical protein